MRPLTRTGWDAGDVRALRAGVAARTPARVIAANLGRTLASVQSKIAALGLSYGDATEDRQTGTTTGHSPVSDESTVASPLNAKPVTLDELLEAFGLVRDEWDVVECTPNVWQVGAKHPESGEILTAPLYQLKARLKAKRASVSDEWKAAVLSDIAADTRARPRVTYKPFAIPEGEAHAVEVDIFDAHFGKLAWGEETGGDYDTEIARSAARAAVSDLLWQSERYPVELFIVPFGNDFFHYDNMLGTTTAGTPQDRDTRLLKMFRQGRSFASWTIRLLAERAPVLAPIVQGNHAAVLEMMLGEVLAAEFAHDPRVTIDNGPKLRKYVQYGANLIAYTHGNEEPHAKLPQIMAAEVPQMWADTTHREWHLGHIHKQRTTGPVTVDDQTGATIRIIRSLSGTDAWHYKKGYVGGTRGAEGFVWRKSGGLRAHLYTFAGSEAA